MPENSTFLAFRPAFCSHIKRFIFLLSIARESDAPIELTQDILKPAITRGRIIDTLGGLFMLPDQSSLYLQLRQNSCWVGNETAASGKQDR
jgi:hypothetical protein